MKNDIGTGPDREEALIMRSKTGAWLGHPRCGPFWNSLGEERCRSLGVDLYLGLQYIPSPWTIFQDLKKLPPAHIMVISKGK